MGCCSSKKSCREMPNSEPELDGQRKKSEQESIVVMEEVSNGQRTDEKTGEGKVDCSGLVIKNGGLGVGGGGAPVRTSSCTREEVDAILIECGRLSRSSSTGKATYSSENDGNSNGDDEVVMKDGRDSHRRERRQSPGRSQRRTPSRERERDKDKAAQPRSGGESSSGGGRRLSRSPGRRSPGRRSESPINNIHRADSNPNSSAPAAAAADKTNSRPGKMVSVPPTVSSLAVADKNTNGHEGGSGGEANTTKRVQAKRSAGGASPRKCSPARLRVSNENQPMSLSRSNSRKAEQSPYRRNPLSDIDSNIIISQVGPAQKPKPEETKGLNVISSGQEKDNLKSHKVARSRSSRLSRDLDINPEALLTNPNASSSYTALLLEDIQNFHQKINPPAAFSSLPPCVTKACSILEAVADLNSSTGSNLSSTFCEGTQRNLSKSDNKRTSGNTKQDPILESDYIANGDDLMQPSFQKYITVGGDSRVGEDLEKQESSGSNNLPGNQQQWVSSSSCWEPDSAESTDHWVSSSSRLVSKQNEVSQTGSQRNQLSESGDSGKRLSAAKKRRESGQQNRVGKGRIGT